MAIIPTPSLIERTSGDFTITATTVIVADNDAAAHVANQLADWIGLAAGDPKPVVHVGTTPPAGAIVLALSASTAVGDEGYELTVTPDGVTIAAHTTAGLFYGVQTFRQLLPAFVEFEAVRPDKALVVKAPAGRVVDRPRFAWRGAMLDVARHFFPVDDVKRYIDLIALYKFNRLHLHLADDQGWRVEIASRPNLAARGAMTEVGAGAGGFYTKAQYREIVAYAAERFITVVPEIDMPGHTNAALASYAELNCDGKLRQPYTGVEVGFSAFCVDKPATYAFIDDIVREIAAMTPGPYFHVGGDEVKTLTPQQYVSFIERVQQIVHKHGKQMIGWDEISAAKLLPTSLVQHWRPEGSPAAAVRQGAKVIMSLANRAYLDMKYARDTAIGQDWAALISVEASYAWDPATLVKDVPAEALAGVEAPIWTETLATIRDVEYLAFPRMAAIADVAWAQPEGRDWNEFRARLGVHGARWTALGVNFYRAPEVPWR